VVKATFLLALKSYSLQIIDKGTQMNWDQIEGNWKQFKGNVKQQWGKLTDDQLDMIAGKREHLAGKIQEVYGKAKDEVEKELTAWQTAQKHSNYSDKTSKSNDVNRTKPM
jgi:uncharacterized protein YjbJ (UPF0337 family)